MTAAEYIFHYGIIAKFGTGANSVSTEVCLKIQSLVEKEFNLTHEGFSKAFKDAENLERLEAEAEKAFFKAHPELNP